MRVLATESIAGTTVDGRTSAHGAKRPVQGEAQARHRQRTQSVIAPHHGGSRNYPIVRSFVIASSGVRKRARHRLTGPRQPTIDGPLDQGTPVIAAGGECQ